MLSCNLRKVCILLSQYLGACRHDFKCFSCNREFHLPGTSITKPSQTKINKITARQKPNSTIGNNSLSKKSKSEIQKDSNPSKTIAPIKPSIESPIEPPIEIKYVGHQSIDDNENLIDNLNDGAETNTTKSIINNNESDHPATKIENLDRFVKNR